ncbi:MAG: CRISPR-associated protein Cas4 [Fimbriimonadaceae bacterium]
MIEQVLVPISAIEHVSYCPRQCGLIHLEAVWEENVFTIRGRLLHERVDEPTTRTERGVRAERALPLWSEKYGLIGKADLVEFRPRPDGGVAPYPVEYKSGGPKHRHHAELQLCAQALCLEEMLGVDVPAGALFFAKTRERLEIPLDEPLRSQTIAAIEGVRRLLSQERLEEPVADQRCPDCSLKDACMPEVARLARRVETRLFAPRPEAELP